MLDKNLKELVRLYTKKKIYDITDYAENSYFKKYLELAHTVYNNFSESSVDEFRSLEFGYLETMKVSGTAFIHGIKDYIFISCGTIVKIHDTFNKLMCNPRVYSEVGKPKYADYKVHINPLVDNGNYQTVFFNGPSDEKRRDLAFLLSFFAVQFIILHEMGHHFNGHLLLLNEITPNKARLALNMANMGGVIDGIRALDYQTLEMDADAFASSASTIFLINQAESGVGLPFNSNISDKNNFYKLMEYWLFSINCLFRIFGEDNITENDMINVKYLPFRVRQSLNNNIPLSVCRMMGIKITDDDYDLLIKRVIPYAEEMYSITFDTSIDYSDIVIKATERVGKHTQLVHDNWKNLRPRLIRYARAKLAD